MKMIKPLYLLLFFFQWNLLYVPVSQATPSGHKLVAMGAAALLAYKGHKFMRTTQTFIPTANNMNILLLTPQNDEEMAGKGKRVAAVIKDIEKNDVKDGDLLCINRKLHPDTWVISKNISANDHDDLFIYSRGNSDRTFPVLDNLIGSNGTPRNGGGLLEAYKYIKEKIINGACVTFDYPDKRGTLSFGQENEKAYLRTVYNEVVKNNPDKKINYVAFCRGGSVGLDFATENPKNLSTLTLESPLISFNVATHFIGTSYLFSIPGAGSLVYNLFRYIFPAYKPEQDNLLERIDKIPKDLPILIGHLKSDAVVSDDVIHRVLQKLKDHEHVYLIVVNDTTKKLFHGHLNSTKPFVQTSNAFLAAYQQTHDKELAQEGKSLLAIARLNAQRKPDEWVMMEYIANFAK